MLKTLMVLSWILHPEIFCSDDNDFIIFIGYTSIIITGGLLRYAIMDDVAHVGCNAVEWIGFNPSRIGPLPSENSAHSLVLTNDFKIMSCGGSISADEEDNRQKCFLLEKEKWVYHSTLSKARCSAIAITMPDGIYVFGGCGIHSTTSEFLPNGSKIWEKGPEIPDPGLWDACGIKVSDEELLIIGGHPCRFQPAMSRILKYNIMTKAWTILDDLNIGRESHTCALLGDKVIVCGGTNFDYPGGGYLASTEVISISGKHPPRKVGDLNNPRCKHGMALTRINDEVKLIAFGGHLRDWTKWASMNKEDWNDSATYLDSIEIWNDQNETWEVSDLKLKEKKFEFGFLSVPSILLCPSINK